MGGPTERAAQLLNRSIRQTYHEQSDGTVHIRTSQDVGPTLEYCKQMRRADAEGRGRFGKRKFFHQKMSVEPNIVYAVAQKLGIPAGKVFDPEYSERIWKELKGLDYKGFRTTEDKRI